MAIERREQQRGNAILDYYKKQEQAVVDLRGESADQAWRLFYPDKLIRIWMMQNIGFESNPHWIIPAEVVKDELEGILGGLRSRGLGHIRASIATKLDGVMTENPFFKAEKDQSISECQAGLARVGRDFSRKYGEQVVKHFGRILKPDGQVSRWFWQPGNAFFDFYEDHWHEDNREKMVGGRLSIGSRFHQPRYHREDVITLELAPGVMGRNMSPSRKGYKMIKSGLVNQQTDVFGNQGICKLSDQLICVEDNNILISLRQMRDRAANKLWRLITQSPEYRGRAVALLQGLKAREVVLDFGWNDTLNRVDFYDCDNADLQRGRRMVLPDRDPEVESYSEIDEILVVGFEEEYGAQTPGDERRRVVESRLESLAKEGVRIKRIDRQRPMEDVRGKTVVLGGRTTDGLVSYWAEQLIDAGASRVIIDEALCMRAMVQPGLSGLIRMNGLKG